MKTNSIHTIISGLVLGSLFCACTTLASLQTWTVPEVQTWYSENYANRPDSSRHFLSSLYYQGTSDKYHYFMARYMDEWVNIKVRKEDLVLEKVNPTWKYKYRSDSTGAFGYYPIDPLNSFKRVKRP